MLSGEGSKGQAEFVVTESAAIKKNGHIFRSTHPVAAPRQGDSVLNGNTCQHGRVGDVASIDWSEEAFHVAASVLFVLRFFWRGFQILLVKPRRLVWHLSILRFLCKIMPLVRSDQLSLVQDFTFHDARRHPGSQASHRLRSARMRFSFEPALNARLTISRWTSVCRESAGICFSPGVYRILTS